MKHPARFLGLMAILFALPALAKEGDTFGVYAAYAHYYDSNLFRLADGENAVIIEDGIPVYATERSDTFNVLNVGVNMDWKPGRQQVLASASKSFVRYSNFSSLDYDGSDYRGTWNWRLGNHWSGQLGASEVVTQTSFNDLDSVLGFFVAVNNLVTRDRQFASAEWELHPRWRAGVGGARASSENSALVQRSEDYAEDSEYAYLMHITPKGSKLSGEIRRIDASYPNRELVAGSLVDNSYTQDEYNFLGDWSVTGKLVAHLKLGFVDRQHENLSLHDYSGVAGRVTADYFPTGKSALNLTVYREPAPLEDVNSSFLLNTGASLNAVWRITDKVTTRAGASYVNGVYDQIVAAGLQREEDTLNGSLSLSYTPVRMATIDVGLQAGRRDSNISVNEYTFHSVFVSVRADF
jgi:exopolysaccharide biosynthesis operon protein EpsL